MINKKVIKISERNWRKLKDMNIGSMDKTLNIIMDSVENKMPFVEYSDDTMKSVNIYEDTFNRINSFRLSDTEAKETIVTRLLITYEDTNIVNIEIPFRLTSPLNQTLILEGIATVDDIIISSKADTIEYKAWLKLLDWNEIQKLVIENKDERISFNKLNYRLEINYSN